MLIGINIVTKMINEIPIYEMLHPKSYTIKMRILSFCIEYSNLLSQNSFIHKVSTQVRYRCKRLKINAKIFYFNKISRALS